MKAGWLKSSTIDQPAMAPGLVSVCKGNVTLMQQIGNAFRNTPTPQNGICPVGYHGQQIGDMP